MQQVEAILVLLASVAALATLARRLKVAYPILMVVGGLALGIVPGLPRTTLPVKRGRSQSADDRGR